MVRRRAGHKLPWWESDAKYKARGRRKAIQYNGEWNDECEEMNKNKRGRPFKFSHGMMTYIAITKALLDISYRELEGFLDGCWGKGHEIPEFTTIWKRIGKTMPRFKQEDISCTVKGRLLRLVVDGTGLAMHNRGEWIRQRWNVKRGFLKLHLLINLDTRRIISYTLTDMNGGDAGQLTALLDKTLKKYTGEGIPLTGQLSEIMAAAESAGTLDTTAESGQRLLSDWMYGAPSESEPSDEGAEDEDLVDEAKKLKDMADDELLRMWWRLKRMGLTIQLWGDGGYDARKVFALLVALGIIPIIRVRINSHAGDDPDGESRARALAVIQQLGGRGNCTNRELNRMVKKERLANQKDWKKRVEYGLRWIVEIVISAFKRVFGESVRALTPHTTNIEIATKIAAYNENLDIGDEEIRRMWFEYRTERLPDGQKQLQGAIA